MTSAVERTKTAPWGLEGGEAARANRRPCALADGTRTFFGKATRLAVPKGATLELYRGGGGGYGPPREREPDRPCSTTCARATVSEATPAATIRTRSRIAE